MNETKKETIRLELQDRGTLAYLYLPGYDEAPRPTSTKRLLDLVGVYRGPDVIFDFSTDNQLIGIEILLDDDESDHDTDDSESL